VIPVLADFIFSMIPYIFYQSLLPDIFLAWDKHIRGDGKLMSRMGDIPQWRCDFFMRSEKKPAIGRDAPPQSNSTVPQLIILRHPLLLVHT